MKLLFKTLLYLFIIFIGIYVLLCAYFYTNQDDMLFSAHHTNSNEVKLFLEQNPSFDTLCFKMSDGNTISGFISNDSAEQKQPVIIYFGGNAEEVSHIVEYKPYLKNCKLILINYRGFGLSTGKTSEKTMFSDAIEIYDKLLLKKIIDAENVFVLGRSIGTGVATYLSSQRKTKATILITPYESMIDVAKEKHPYLPVSLILKHKFNSKLYAKDISNPVFALIAQNDRVIPPYHAHELLKHWKGKTSFMEFNEDHNSIISNSMVWKSIQEFITANP